MKNKIILFIKIIIFLALVAGIGYGVYYIYEHYLKEDDSPVVVKKLNEIEGYGYTLSDNDTKLYKDEFNKLKTNLDSKEVNYEEYAKSIATLFTIDLYNLDNKLNKYDVGGVEFVYPSALDNYRLNVENTIYKYVEDNTRGKRDQVLPIVNQIEITDFAENKFNVKAENKTYDGYKVKLKIGYHYNLGYDKEAEVIIINKDNILYVVEKN